MKYIYIFKPQQIEAVTDDKNRLNIFLATVTESVCNYHEKNVDRAM